MKLPRILHLCLIALPLAAGAQAATTYHVREDGGTDIQCNGRADAPYPGSGLGKDCAWMNPMVALPPGGRPRIAGGDTLVIHAGQYMIGLGAPGSSGVPACSASYPWECAMAAVPSGPDAAHPTRILGEGHDRGCPAAPQLWGTERVRQVLSLEGTRHAQVACLEITDHAECAEFHSGGKACPRENFPFGNWSSVGLYAADSSDVQLSDLNIHGLAGRGVHAGRLRDWTLERVRIAGNGSAGWDGDIGAQKSSNAGRMIFRKLTIEWNGCVETWPGGKPTHCWAQSAGGYGDGMGTHQTAGDWLFEDSVFRFNTSDGLDLLYHADEGSITVRRSWAEGNAGNQLKLAGPSAIENTVVIGTCGHFRGKPYSYKVDDCRANGDAVVFATKAATRSRFVNNTVLCEGNVAVLAGGPAGAQLVLRNNILVGLPWFLDPDKQSADTYAEGGIALDDSHGLKQSLRNAACRGTGTKCGDAGLVSASRLRPDPHLTVNSPARSSGTAGGPEIPADDHDGRKRDRSRPVDRGAFQTNPTTPR